MVIAQLLAAELGDADWALTINTDGRTKLIFPPHQNPGRTAIQLADGLHAVGCSGCARCAN